MNDDKEIISKKTSQKIRKFLWLNHGCTLSGLCDEDGEMLCNHITKHDPIDFKRDSFDEIAEKISGFA
jgi:hypothetical protein